MAMLTVDLDSTKVLLVGFSEYPKDAKHLSPLPAVKNNINDMENIFLDPEIIGIPRENIAKIIDEGTNADVARRIYEYAKAAEDTFILYYSGHGLIGKASPELYLATSETSEESADFTALPFNKVRQAINESPAKKKILIIDCCFSGRALKEVMGSKTNLLQSQMDIKGTYAMASAPANKLAIAPEGARHTAFTGELIRALGQGIDNQKDTLTLADIFDHIRGQLSKDPKLPEPQHVTNLDPGNFILARNRRSQIQWSVNKQIAEIRDLIERKFSEYDKQITELKGRETPTTYSQPSSAFSLKRRLHNLTLPDMIYSILASSGLIIWALSFTFLLSYNAINMLQIGAALILGTLIYVSVLGMWAPKFFLRFFEDVISPRGLLWSAIAGLVTVGISWVVLQSSGL